ncbi:unnamed protein product [Pleuronectes platessa]|uniref:Uncharacterized protein n=1 Tax=Pleuronectes platessa TaxID=8262 RepID=A0A9N7YM21_PLEPL|nr:unnamed protein product [Pleuronectes platessa]
MNNHVPRHPGLLSEQHGGADTYLVPSQRCLLPRYHLTAPIIPSYACLVALASPHGFSPPPPAARPASFIVLHATHTSLATRDRLQPPVTAPPVCPRPFPPVPAAAGPPTLLSLLTGIHLSPASSSPTASAPGPPSAPRLTCHHT